MTDDRRAVAESVFELEPRREPEIKPALKLEQARHDAAIKNMERLRALRLSQAKGDTAAH